jgi:hypothetical protein
MSAVTDDLRMLPQRAADWIDTHGWVQGTERNAAGAVCLTGALRFCSQEATPTVQRKAKPGEAREWLDSALSGRYDTDSCILWPFGLSQGYACINENGHSVRVMHLSLERSGHPRPAAPANVSLHSCDNPLCINPRHLRWGTHAENTRDAVDRGRLLPSGVTGESHPGAKLTADNVAEIRASSLSGAALAAKFGVSKSAVNRARRGATWSAPSAVPSPDPKPGDWLIAREVFRQRHHAESWNDADGRTKDEVQDYLRSVEITDAELAKTFGPQWESIVALVRTAATITPQQGNELDAAWAAARAATWAAAGAAAGDAAWAAAGDAAWAAARADTWAAARDAARDAAWALSVRDLIGQHGFTQAHYDLLTAPWVKVMGPVHPDDKPVSA